MLKNNMENMKRFIIAFYLHHATVSMLNVYIYNNEVIKLSKNSFLIFYNIKINNILVLNLSFTFLMTL